MKGITLTQPFASIIALGAKSHETRGWSTPYRGPLAIHAAQGLPKWAALLIHDEPYRSVLAPAGITTFDKLPRAVIVAVGDLVEIVETDSWADKVSQAERDFGDWSPGRYAWRMENIRALPEPIACRGTLGLWDVPSSVVDSLQKGMHECRTH